MRARLERWAPWLAAVVLVAGVAAFVSTRYTGSASAPAPPHRAAPLATAELQLVYEFLGTAVARKHLDRAWNIVAPELKQGMSLDEWKTGTIPVVPYPVAQASVAVHTVNSFTDAAHLRVTFAPRAGATVKPATFAVDLRNVDGHWLVSAWQPSSVVGPGAGK